jgi:integrase
MAGRPPLRIGAHGKITRKYQGGNVWLARCRFRDSDGVTRIVQRVGPPDEHDQHGKLAEDALIGALVARRPPSGPDAISLDTLVMALVDQYLRRLAEDGRAALTLSAYRYDADKLAKFIAGVRVGEATPARLDAALRSIRTAHGVTAARRARTLLRGGLALAVLNNVLGSNPVRDVQMIRSKSQPKGATALTADQLRELFDKLRASTFCREQDLTDPITLLIATGLRRSELLGLRWSDYDDDARTITITGKIVRVPGKGLVRVDETKTAAGRRTIPLPKFAVETLQSRRALPYLGEQSMIFPSTSGTLRCPDHFGRQWNTARDELGVPDVTTHSFRKTVATLIDDEGLSARIGADHLGHSHVSMTQDRYMTRGKMHMQVPDLLDRTISGELPMTQSQRSVENGP